MAFKNDIPNYNQYPDEELFMHTVPEEVWSSLGSLVRKSAENTEQLRNLLNTMAEISGGELTENWGMDFLQHDIKNKVYELKKKVSGGRIYHFEAFMDTLAVLYEVGKLSCDDINEYLVDVGIGYQCSLDFNRHIVWECRESLITDEEIERDDTYEIREEMGQGGFGHVYRYHNNFLDMDFAVKIYDPLFVMPDEKIEGEKRFFREAKMLFSLNHPNIVRIYDVGRLHNKPFIRMEFIKGESLSDYYDRKGKLNPKDALKAVRYILLGLGHAHQKDIIHRDLKPQNVMVTECDGRNTCKIIDFGVSAFMDTDSYTKLTKTGDGVPGGLFIDPRLMENPKLRDKRTDIYSAGAILYFLLCGRAPAGSDVISYLKESNNAINDEVIKMIEKSISGNLEDRYNTCEEFIEEINTILEKYYPEDNPMNKEIVTANQLPVFDND